MSKYLVIIATVCAFAQAVPAVRGQSAVAVCNKDVELSIESATCTKSVLLNKAAGESCALDGDLFAIETSRGVFATSGMKLARAVRAGEGAALEFEQGADKARVEIEPMSDAPAIEMRVVFVFGEETEVRAVRHGSVSLSPVFEEAEALRDPRFCASLCVLLRGGKGAIFAGAAWPYVKQDCSTSGFSLSYPVNVKIAKGAEFKAEPFFLGAARHTGRFAFWESVNRRGAYGGPMNGRDWGEIFALQKTVEHYLPFLPLATDGYYIVLNCWWAGLPEKMDEKAADEYCRVIDLLAEHKINDLLLAGNHWAMGGSYSDYSKEDPYFSSLGEDFDLQLSEPVKRVIEHGKARGVGVGSWGMPLKPMRVADKPRTWQSAANREFIDWYLKATLKMIGMSNAQWWGWDTGWPGLGYAGLKNVMAFMDGLRAVYPRICLETYYGLRSECPWAMAKLNAQENYHESQGIEHDRLTTWFLQNVSLTPVHKNMGAFAAGDSDGINRRPATLPDVFEYNMLSTMSSSAHMQLRNAVWDLEEKANSAIFKKWRAWADRNAAYLRVKRDVFGVPGRPGGVLDGSAHFVGGRGYVFIFNPAEQLGLARICADELLGCTAETAYAVAREYGDRQDPLGAVAYGKSFVAAVPPKSWLLLAFEPTAQAGSSLKSPVLSTEELSELTAEADLILEDAFTLVPTRADLALLKARGTARFDFLGPLPAAESAQFWGAHAADADAAADALPKAISEDEMDDKTWSEQVLTGESEQTIRPSGREYAGAGGRKIYWHAARSEDYVFMPSDRSDGVWLLRIEATAEADMPARLLVGVVDRPTCRAAIAVNSSVVYDGALSWPVARKPCALTKGKNTIAIKTAEWAKIYCRLEDTERHPLRAATLPRLGARNYALAANGGKAAQMSQGGLNLNDGNTRYYSGTDGYASAELHQPVDIELAEVKTVSCVSVRFWDGEAGRYHRYSIEVSRDGTDWRMVVDKRKAGNWAGWQVDEFEPIEAKYVRLVCTECTTKYTPGRFALVEMEVYGPEQ